MRYSTIENSKEIEKTRRNGWPRYTTHGLRHYKKVKQYLRQEAERTKEIQNKKYWKKIQHIEDRYRIEKEEKTVPPGMEKLSHLTVFSEELFDKIQKDEIQVPKIGEIELTPEEEEILRKNPKFSLPEKLLEDTIREDMEKAYSLMRME